MRGERRRERQIEIEKEGVWGCMEKRWEEGKGGRGGEERRKRGYGEEVGGREGEVREREKDNTSGQPSANLDNCLLLNLSIHQTNVDTSLLGL